MIQFLVRRFVIGALTLLLITFVVFALIRNMPGTPLTTDPAMMDPSRRIDPKSLERLKRLYGLDKPWPVAYGVWIGNLAKLDLGRSISRRVYVTTLIRERVGPTLLLSTTSLLLAYLLSIPMGLWPSVKSGGFLERTVSAILYMLYSLPSFVAALFLQILFAVRLGWLPLLGMTSDAYETMSIFGKSWDITLHSLMPVACFTYGSLAYYTRFIHSNMGEVIRQDYIRTARAKGVSPYKIIVHHAFRNTLIPLVTMIGLTLPGLLSGAIILERIFTWPGMGSLFFDAITERDYPTIMGLTLMFSVLTLAGQLLADILYAVVDPRVTYS